MNLLALVWCLREKSCDKYIFMATDKLFGRSPFVFYKLNHSSTGQSRNNNKDLRQIFDQNNGN